MTSDLPNTADPVGGGTAWVPLWVVLISLAAIASTIAMMGRGGVGGLFLPTLAFVMCLLSAGFDAATGRIPNQITYAGILIGLAINALAPTMHSSMAQWLGSAGPRQSLMGFGISAGIGLACFIVGMGGGDMKLLAAVGAVLGWQHAASVLAWSLLFAVVYSLVNLALAGRLNGFLRFLAVSSLNMIFLRQPIPKAPPSRTLMPMAVALVVGIVVSAGMRFQRIIEWVGGWIG